MRAARPGKSVKSFTKCNFLAQGLKAQGKLADADTILKTYLMPVLEHADIQIPSSCPIFALA